MINILILNQITNTRAVYPFYCLFSWIFFVSLLWLDRWCKRLIRNSMQSICCQERKLSIFSWSEACCRSKKNWNKNKILQHDEEVCSLDTHSLSYSSLMLEYKHIARPNRTKITITLNWGHTPNNSQCTILLCEEARRIQAKDEEMSFLQNQMKRTPLKRHSTHIHK